jgi:hypothetical protein
MISKIEIERRPELASEAISNAAGGSNYVRVQVLTPINVLNREKQLDVVRELTETSLAPQLVIRLW